MAVNELLNNTTLACFSPLEFYCYVRFIAVRTSTGIVSMYNPESYKQQLLATQDSYWETHPLVCETPREVIKQRWNKIQVEYSAVNGVAQKISVSGPQAACIQHYFELMDNEWTCQSA
jgi:peptide deformylase